MIDWGNFKWMSKKVTNVKERHLLEKNILFNCNSEHFFGVAALYVSCTD